MALIINFDSAHGLNFPLYWRLNNFEQLGNREPDGSRIPAVARFRAFASEAAFKDGKNFLEEMLVEFQSSSINADMAAEAYAALKALDPSVATAFDLEEKRKAISLARDAEQAAIEASKAAPEDDELKRAAMAATALRGAHEEGEQAEIARHEAAVARRKAIAKAKKA